MDKFEAKAKKLLSEILMELQDYTMRREQERRIVKDISPALREAASETVEKERKAALLACQNSRALLDMLKENARLKAQLEIAKEALKNIKHGGCCEHHADCPACEAHYALGKLNTAKNDDNGKVYVTK